MSRMPRGGVNIPRKRKHASFPPPKKDAPSYRYKRPKKRDGLVLTPPGIVHIVRMCLYDGTKYKEAVTECGLGVQFAVRPKKGSVVTCMACLAIN